jgi:signal recognition particle receptor subunit beta
MAFLATVIRWPDAIGVRATAAIASIQPHLPAPLSTLSPELLLSIAFSFTFILLLAVAAPALRGVPGSSNAISASSSSASHKHLKARETPNVLVVGPSGVGKTSLFSALAFESVPSVHPSQRESETILTISAKGKNELKVARKRNIHLIDTPGHPRIKDKIIADHMNDADVVVFCIDAKEALRGSASAGQTKDSSIVEAVDHLHSVLTQLVKNRRNAKTRPPTFLILFTRSDLSPHLTNISLNSTAPEDIKRKSILLSRAQTTLETELGKRRAGMGLGAKRSSKVGGMTKVVGGSEGEGLWTTIKGLLGWRSTLKADIKEEDEEEDEEVQDYLVAKTSDTTTATPTMTTTTSLNRLNTNTVYDGSVKFAFAALGTERGWSERSLDGVQELKQILMDV